MHRFAGFGGASALVVLFQTSAGAQEASPIAGGTGGVSAGSAGMAASGFSVGQWWLLIAVVAVSVIAALVVAFRHGSEGSDIIRMLTTFAMAIIGILVVVVVFAQTIPLAGDTQRSKDAMSLAGTVIAMVGTLVGFVAGQAAGAAGRDKAEEQANKANERAAEASRQVAALASAANAEVIARAQEIDPTLFKS